MAVVSLFVSSTFRDFHGERDALVGPVRAVLDERLAPYGCRVEVVDLRWGVAAGDDGLTDEERQRRVLDVCLGEINRSRPLFLGLVGLRYGWVPPLARVRRVAAEAGLEHIDLTDRSVTALEIEHGVFSRSDIDAILLVRDAVGELPEGWQDADTGPIEALRERVLSWDGGQVHTYQVATDGRRVVDLSAFEALAIEVLGPLVEKRARQLIGERPDPYVAAQERFFEDRGGVVAGRDRVLDEVFAALEAGAGRCLIGVSGVGKSAVWCAALSRLRAAGRRVITLVIGVAPDSTSLAAAVRILAGQLGQEVPAGLDEESLLDWFRGVLAAAGPLVVAVDGLDGLDAGDVRERLPLLTGLPASTTVLASTTLETQATLLERVGVAPVVLSDLRAAEVPGVIDALLRQVRRQLPRAAIDALARAPRSPLWLSLAFSELLVLDEDDFVALDVTLDPAMALDALLVDTVLGLPSDVEDLIHRILDRVEERFGRDVVSDALGLLAVSRSGLTQLDLVELTGHDELTVAGIRRGLRALVSVRGVGGRLGFAHGVVAEVLTARYARDPTWLHTRLAGHLHASSERDAVREDDLLWHLLYAAGEPTPALVLNRLAPFTPEAERAAMVLTDAFGSAGPHFSRFDTLDHTGIDVINWVSEQRSSGRLSVADLEMLTRTALHQARRLVASEPASALARRNMSVALANSGTAARSAGDLKQASEAYDESLQLRRALAAENPDDTRAQRDLRLALWQASSVAEDSGDTRPAVQLFGESLQMLRQVFDDQPNLQSRLEVAVAMSHAARLSLNEGAHDEAARGYDLSLRMARDLAEDYPKSVPVRRAVLGALEGVGLVALKEGKLAQAARVFDEMVELARELAEADPASSGAQEGLASALEKAAPVGVLLMNPRAGQHFDELLAIRRRLADADTSNSEAEAKLAKALDVASSVMLRIGGPARAAKLYDEALGIRRKLADADSRNVTARSGLAAALESSGRVALELGRNGRASQLLEEALEIRRRLADADPRNVAARSGLAAALESNGRVARVLGKEGRASELLEEALALRRVLVDDDPTFAARSSLQELLGTMGDNAREMGQLDRAMRAYGEMAELAGDLVETDRNSLPARWGHSAALRKTGDLARETGDIDRATHMYDRLLDTARWLCEAQPDNESAAKGLAEALNLVGSVALSVGRAGRAEQVFEESQRSLTVRHDSDPIDGARMPLLIEASTGLADARLASHRDREAAVGLVDAVEYLLDHAGGFTESDAAQLLGKLDEVRVALGPRDLLLARRCRRLVKRLLNT